MKKSLSILLKVLAYFFYAFAALGLVGQIIAGDFHLIYTTITVLILVVLGWICMKISKKMSEPKG